jgi:DNA-binding LacI/PurR family transcriptional regulator
MALGALQAARRLGLRVPEELGIVGFDDIPEAAYFYPPLTTVHQDARNLGAIAVERINTLIKAQQEGETLEPKTLWLEPRMMVRESSVRK